MKLSSLDFKSSAYANSAILAKVEQRGSNPRPLEPQSSALPTELHPTLMTPAGLEPDITCVKGACPHQLDEGAKSLPIPKTDSAQAPLLLTSGERIHSHSYVHLLIESVLVVHYYFILFTNFKILQ